RKIGIAQVVTCRNGDLVKLAPGNPGVIDEVPEGRIYKDGRLLVDAEARTVADRRRLSMAVVVTVGLALDDKGMLAADPEVELIGIPEADADGQKFAEIAYNAALETVEQMPRARRRDPDAIGESVKRAVRAVIAQRWGKKPLCVVLVAVV
ncbi:MAG TPA: MBL fold metallo-hydrolase, partial [Xanthobacteraceae bacterium]